MARATTIILNQNSDSDSSDSETDDDDSSGTSEDDVPPPMSQPPSTNTGIAFCCYICRCDKPAASISQCFDEDKGYYHRHCCHGIPGTQVPTGWLSPVEQCFQQVTKQFAKILEQEEDGDGDGDAVSTSSSDDDDDGDGSYLQNVKQAHTTSQQEEASMFAAATDPVVQEDGLLATLRSDPRYKAFSVEFHKCVARRRDRWTRTNKAATKPPHPAHVLDLFSGVGSGLLALKRLGVAIDRYTYVDHDHGANHVLEYNHYDYGNQVAWLDLINYRQYPDFDTVEQNLDQVLSRPVDVILASPPCHDDESSSVFDKQSLLLRTMQLIQAIQAHPLQHGRSVFCMVEHAAADVDEKGREQANDAFGGPPILLDAQYFSPCRRQRHYWVNFPLDDYDFDGPRSKCTPYLETGWTMLDDLVQTSTPPSASKANTFMASASRLDDYPRMAKAQKIKREYKHAPYSLQEREWMMGYPEGYVSKPLQVLYRELMEAVGARSLSHRTWHETLDTKYWHFSGFSYFDFYVTAKKKDEPQVAMKLAPHTPLRTKGPHYSEDQMGKHLLGSGHSIPVLEYVLRPLTVLFAKRKYEGMNYKYRWKEPTAAAAAARS